MQLSEHEPIYMPPLIQLLDGRHLANHDFPYQAVWPAAEGAQSWFLRCGGRWIWVLATPFRSFPTTRVSLPRRRAQSGNFTYRQVAPASQFALRAAAVIDIVISSLVLTGASETAAASTFHRSIRRALPSASSATLAAAPRRRWRLKFSASCPHCLLRTGISPLQCHAVDSANRYRSQIGCHPIPVVASHRVAAFPTFRAASPVR